MAQIKEKYPSTPEPEEPNLLNQPKDNEPAVQVPLRRQRQQDAEIVAMGRILNILKEQPEDAQYRIVDWLRGRTNQYVREE